MNQLHVLKIALIISNLRLEPLSQFIWLRLLKIHPKREPQFRSKCESSRKSSLKNCWLVAGTRKSGKFVIERESFSIRQRFIREWTFSPFIPTHTWAVAKRQIIFPDNTNFWRFSRREYSSGHLAIELKSYWHRYRPLVSLIKHMVRLRWRPCSLAPPGACMYLYD